MPLKHPYQFFGSKAKVADEIWRRFGRCDFYIDPFFGSGSVLLANPYWQDMIEVVNDIDHYIVNFWRAIKAAPEEVYKYADHPCLEADVHARHLWLTNEGREILKRCAYDPDFYDAKIAGWWVWGMTWWFGAEFCSGYGPWDRAKLKKSLGVEPEPGDYSENKVLMRIPLVFASKGTARKSFLDYDQSTSDTVFGRAKFKEYIFELSRRMFNVRVCCGDWHRVVTDGVLSKKGSTYAILLDPPYMTEQRDRVYANDDHSISKKVEQWCAEHGNNKSLRIALCGHEGNYNLPGWTVYAWEQTLAIRHRNNSDGAEYRKKERIWFSPHCLKPEVPAGAQLNLIQ